MDDITKLKLAWRFRRPLWKYRKLWKYRREIGGLAMALGAVGAIVLWKAGGGSALRRWSRPEEAQQTVSPAPS